jgi:hypothetical protein
MVCPYFYLCNSLSKTFICLIPFLLCGKDSVVSKYLGKLSFMASSDLNSLSAVDEFIENSLSKLAIFASFDSGLCRLPKPPAQQ